MSEIKRQVPNINLAPQEWTNNVLVPATFKKFSRQGAKLLLVFFIVCGLGFASFFVARQIRNSYEEEITATQENSGSLIRKYLFLQERTKELAQLAEWRNELSLSEQFAALSWFFSEKKCFLANAVYYSNLNHLSEKMTTETRANLERAAKIGTDALKILGIWEISLWIPLSGINTTAARNTIFTTLQRDIPDVFKITASNATLFTQENTTSSKGNDRLNVVVVIWNRKVRT